MNNRRRNTIGLFILVLACIAAFSTWIVDLNLEVVHLWAVSATIAFIAAVLATWLVLRGKP